MIYFLKHIKAIAYFLAILILFQSCVAIYKNSSVAEASRQDNRSIKIKTVDGEKYRFPWVDEKNGNVVSIENIERVFIDKDKVKQIISYDPNPHVIPLDSVTSHNGPIQVLIKERRNNFESQDFIKFEKQGDFYKCYKMTGEDTLTVFIPLEQVEKIKVINKEATGGVTFLVWFAVLTGFSVWAVSNMEIDMNFSH